MAKSAKATTDVQRALLFERLRDAKSSVVETTARDNFTGLEARMKAAGFTWLDITDDAVITSLII